MKTKILVVTHDAKDANSFWRCMGPFLYLSKYSKGEIELTVKNPGKDDLSWTDVMGQDLVFLHRPCTRNDLAMIQAAQVCNVPTWIDYDDWLFDVPQWNPNQNFYNNPGTKVYVAHCIATADVVSVSTTELFNQFRKVNQNTVILTNAYRSDLFTYREQEVAPRKPLAIWRGTCTHEGDLQSVAQGFRGLKAKVHFLGGPPWSVLNQMNPESYSTLTNQEFMEYFRYIYGLKPKVLLFPLKDCLFNRCKSNIAWMEAIHAGALCVAPALPEWDRPGVIQYEADDPFSFRDAANQAIEMPEDLHKEQVSIAFEYMNRQYGIEKVNRERMSVLTQILEPKFKRNFKDPRDQILGLWALSQLTPVPMVKKLD